METRQIEERDLEALNREFVAYLNVEGYPEALFSPVVQADPGRFIKADIVDKVLLRDLPSLYGSQDIQELNYLFTTLAFNTAGEVDLVYLDEKQKPAWAVEVKWSDRSYERPEELSGLLRFCRSNGLREVVVTTRSKSGRREVDRVVLHFVPTSLYTYEIDRNIVRGTLATTQWARALAASVRVPPPSGGAG